MVLHGIKICYIAKKNKLQGLNMTSNCRRHERCIEDAIQQAQIVCDENNSRFTTLRKRILELVWANHEPVKAYDLLKTYPSKFLALSISTFLDPTVTSLSNKKTGLFKKVYSPKINVL